MTSAPATPPPGRKRKHRPRHVEFNACIYKLGERAFREAYGDAINQDWLALALTLLGVDPTLPYDFQHEPPLGIRPFNAKKDDYEPAENDFRFLRPMQRADHKKVTSEVDRPAIDRTRRSSKTQRKHAEAMAEKGKDRTASKPKHRWPKGRKIASRPFQKRRKP